MASATRLPIKSLGFTAALVLTVGASRANIKNLLLRTVTGPGSYSRIAIILVAVANLKNLPSAWHVRIFKAIIQHCVISLPNIPPKIAPSTIFLPVITSSYAPLMECDYNFHKSNSTYFSDLDATRSHLVCCLLQPGIHALQTNPKTRLVLDKEGNAFKGRWSIMLGSVMSSFKREIGIYQKYEMWSRLLCWDRKWIYIITHFVKKGVVKPKEYILTDGSWFGGKGYRNAQGDGKAIEDLDEKAIFASAISKYVMKLGRLTIHPEVVMQASGILPPKPGGWHSMSRPSGQSTPEDLTAEVSESEDDTLASAEDWNWKRVEAENKKGLKYAEHFAALDNLHQEFSGSKEAALGKYKDFIL